MVSANYARVDASGTVLKHVERQGHPLVVSWRLLFCNYVEAHSAAFLRRDAVAAVGGYDESCMVAQDYALWLALLRHGDIAILPEELLYYRIHGANIGACHGSAQRQVCLAEAEAALHVLGLSSITSEEVAALADFWLRVYPIASKPLHLRALLGQATSLFSKHHASEIRNTPPVWAQIKRSVAEHFVHWATNLPFGSALRAKSEAIFSAWHFCPAVVMRYLLRRKLRTDPPKACRQGGLDSGWRDY